ncbi:MAG TPA: (2Fe-2S) ferredoxin domain-containing protein [Chloroflexaceae bacterium]|nr:(2Fe-2S) ferredoxin domain-containing protein [Chloroflexaceae bacterium]
MYRIYLCHGPHCSARGAEAARRALDQALWDADLLGEVELMASSCQDHCDHGPNLLVHPGACRYVGLTPERAATIVARHLRDGEPVAEWRATPEMRRGPS